MDADRRCPQLIDQCLGGIFQYEIVFVKALGEIAARCPGELVYLCYNGNDLLTLAGAEGLNCRGLVVAPLIGQLSSGLPQAAIMRMLR
jgi:hypothetical protein